MWFRITLLLACLTSGLLVQAEHVTIKVGVIIMESAPEPFDLRRIGPAIDIALEHIHDRYNISFETVVRTYAGVCPYEPAVGILSELYHMEGIKAVLGPACSQGLMASARLAQYFRLPMVTGLGDLVIRQTGVDMFESLTILSYNLQKLSYSVAAIMKAYQWYHTAVLYDKTYVFFDLAGSNLVDDLKARSDVARPYDIPFMPAKVNDYGDLLLEAKANARVFLIFCDSDTLRDILYRAYQLGMADGDFVFITMELFPSDWLGHYMLFLRDDNKDAEVTKAYESLLILTLRQPDNPEYETFAQEVKKKALEDYGYDFGDEKVNYFITAFYDGTIYLAEAYRTVLDEGGDIDDGMHVAQRLWNNTFGGITGPVRVDGVGNRVADFDLFHMVTTATREFKIVGRFRGATQRYSPTPGVSIAWPNGKPVDIPACGFSGELCIEIPRDLTTAITIICVTIVAVTMVAIGVFLFVYRKYKEEQELGRKTWLVQSDEIKIRKARFNDSFISKSCLTLETNDEQAQLFTQTAYCRNHVVAVRKLHLEQMEETRQLFVECRQMQLMSHANIAKFIGACLDPNKMCILMEYCSRGSLQDLLHNDSIELEIAFKYSLIDDIIKGMRFLHDSPLRVHGRLSSTNCVIDSRFALKLTDFGPPTLINKDREFERRHSMTAKNFNERKLLWTAPEILRYCRHSSAGSVGMSKHGDVFSFAIILQEICTRSEPYEENCMDLNDILDKLMKPEVSLLRPIVPESCCSPQLVSMMQSCWTEKPEERPSFNDLEDTFRKVRQKAGNITNIMDNLLQRMANYADNLEQLAAERTKAYLEEKQKVEELLHRLLPQTVADQLQAGKPVNPETFECVSIYFSDIVGFTTLASKSTPIEVVDLLNDLYTAFDSSIDKYHVYKVETIGDAYMCVSGLPERIENRHVTEICNMSLEILRVVRGFKIRSMPHTSLKVRIGINSGQRTPLDSKFSAGFCGERAQMETTSAGGCGKLTVRLWGPVVAGVVGLTMPRYCLFGDTVNTASRMESTSESMKIQLSSETKRLLEEFPSYKTETRGEIEIKGKGTMTTYWLKEDQEVQENGNIGLTMQADVKHSKRISIV